VLVVLVGCAPQNRIRLQRDNTTITRDSVSVQYYKDSLRTDTVSYRVKRVATDKGAVRVKGVWYVITYAIVSTAIAILLITWIKK